MNNNEPADNGDDNNDEYEWCALGNIYQSIM